MKSDVIYVECVTYGVLVELMSHLEEKLNTNLGKIPISSTIISFDERDKEIFVYSSLMSMIEKYPERNRYPFHISTFANRVIELYKNKSMRYYLNIDNYRVKFFANRGELEIGCISVDTELVKKLAVFIQEGDYTKNESGLHRDDAKFIYTTKEELKNMIDNVLLKKYFKTVKAKDWEEL